METQPSKSLDRIFQALSDPTRRSILGVLRKGPATVGEIARPFSMSQPAISKHLKVLEDAGLILKSRDAQRRPRELNKAAMQALDDWLGPFRKEWDARFDNLNEHIAVERARKS